MTNDLREQNHPALEATTPAETQPEALARFNRRQMLGIATGLGVGALGLGVTTRLVMAQDGYDYGDDDDKKDDDNSGSGSDDDKDDDDHSGHGGGDDDDDDDDGENDHVDPNPDTGEIIADPLVNINDEIFVPGFITIAVGTTVTWTNNDDDQHTASGAFTTSADVINPGDSVTATFDEVGEFNYTCAFHPEMLGTITVVDPDATGTPAATPEASPAASGSSEVNIDNIAFDPQVLTVSAGTTVTWANNDIVDHTVTGDWNDSGVIAVGSSFEFTFDEVGSFDYICAIHPNMTGTVVVE